MSRIFLSHSSDDDFEALALRDWLAAEGWSEVFLDVDPNRGIAAGERWERALHAAAQRCEAVIFLVSRNWLASGWCRKEHALAAGLNKTLLAGVVDPELRIADLPSELKESWQIVSLVGGELQLFRVRRPASHDEKHIGFSRDGLARLRRGLTRAGLDPRSFVWPPESDPGRSPYRGLKPMEAEDAGVFFGRDAPVVEAVDLMRRLQAGASPRIFVILGASGAGKSSFLRAGLLPRLMRDDRRFLALPPVRPEHEPLWGEQGLLAALEKALPDRNRAELREALRGGAERLAPLLLDAARRAGERAAAGGEPTRPPAVVIAIDQAEELFRDEARQEATQLLALAADLAAREDLAVIVVFTIRSDSYDRLQQAEALSGLKQTAMPLLPMPRGAYSEVIEGPARRVREAGGKLDVDPLLTQRLLEDLDRGGGADALPLLAVTLEQLYLEYRKGGALRLADFLDLGELAGGIDAAVERALRRADARPDVPRDRVSREDLLRRGFIPWLAGVDPDSVAARRNIAVYEDLPPATRPLLDLLVEERLLLTDVARAPSGGAPESQRAKTIEPAHEALLRHWGLLAGWLNADRGLLATLEDVRRAAKVWRERAAKPEWLVHRGLRLQEALALRARPDLTARLEQPAGDYLAACEQRERAEAQAQRDAEAQEEEHRRKRLADAEALASSERRVAQRTRRGLVASLALLAAVCVAAGFAWLQWSEARGQARTALAAREDSAEVARLARSELTTVNVDLGDRVDDMKAWVPSEWRATLDHWRALAHQNARDFVAERRDLDAELQLNPDFAPALVASSDNYVMTGEAEAAARDAKAALALGTRDASAFANLALADAMRRDYDQALAEIDAALAQAPRVLSATESLVAVDVQAFTGGFKLWVRDTDFFVALRYEKAALAAMRGAGLATALDAADKADRDYPASRQAYLLALNWEWLILRGQARAAAGAAAPANSDYGAFVAEAAMWRRVAATRPAANANAESALARFAAASAKAPRADYKALSDEAPRAAAALPRLAEPASPLAEARDLEVRALEWAEGSNASGDAFRSAPAAERLTQAIAALDAGKPGRALGRREEDALIDLRLRRAALRLRAGDRGGAIEDARAALGLDDKIAAGHSLLGAALTAPADRRAEYERALALDPSDVNALDGLAWRIAPSSPAAALDLLDRARRFRIFGPEDWARVADFSGQNHDFARASQAIDFALRLAPGDAKLYAARRRLSQPDDAALATAADLHDRAKFLESAGEPAGALGDYAAAVAALDKAAETGALARERESLLRDFNAFLIRRYGTDAATAWWRALAANPLTGEGVKTLAGTEAAQR